MPSKGFTSPSGAPIITASVPASAPLTLPLTGASTTRTPCDAARAARLRVLSGPTVERSKKKSPLRAPAMSPGAAGDPKRAASTARASGRLSMVTRTARASAGGSAARVAPDRSSGAVAAGLRSNTVSWWPALRMFAAMGRPMFPVPTKPTFMGVSC